MEELADGAGGRISGSFLVLQVVHVCSNEWIALGCRSNMYLYLPSVCPVDADLVDLCGVFAEILDVAEHMAAAVLADEVAKVCTQAHVCDGRLVVTP